jgi:predicted transcriptional regulator
MHKTGLSKAETRILGQYWKLGTCSVREIPDSLAEDERVAYTTVQTLVYRLEQKGALRAVGRGVQHRSAWGVLGTVSHTA